MATDYSAFCAHYRDWVEPRAVMRQVHKAGEKLFVDYSGKKPEVVDGRRALCVAVELFVAVLGASNYTYAEATETAAECRFHSEPLPTVEYLGGGAAAIVPDQLKARRAPTRAATNRSSSAPTKNGAATTRRRSARPTGEAPDKAKVEVAVQVAQTLDPGGCGMTPSSRSRAQRCGRENS